jgi:cytochrome P450
MHSVLVPLVGGKFICLGRQLARHVHAAFVAILLRKYDIEVVEGQQFPRVAVNEAAIGGSRALMEMI